MEQATIEKEFYIETANLPGITSQLTSLLSEEAHVNLKAFLSNTYAGKGHFWFIPESLSKARQALKSSQFNNYREEEVVVVYVKDETGSMAEIVNKLANAHININWMYTTSYNGRPAIVLSCDDNSRAVQTIQH